MGNRPRANERPSIATSSKRLALSLFEIALHEGAHAVVAWATGIRVLGLAMVTDAEYDQIARRHRPGTSWGQAYFPGPPASISKDRHRRTLADREAMVSLAGDLAVRMYRGAPLRKQPTDSDLDAVVHAAALAVAAGEDAEVHLGRLTSKTVLILSVYWDGSWCWPMRYWPGVG